MSDERRNDRNQSALVAWLTAGLVSVSALALGGVHLVVLAPLAIFAAVAAGIAIHGQSRPKLCWPAVISMVLAAYCLLQSIPLPSPWLARISAPNADVWARALTPFAEVPAWAPISLDPGASTVEALKWFTYGCVFVCAARVSDVFGPAVVLAILFGAAVAVAVATVGHGLLDANGVWGFYRPSFAPSRWHVGPLLNPNNLAGYLNLGALAGIGLSIARKPRIPRLLLAAGVALLIATEIIAASRGALLALCAGIAVIASWLLLSRSSDRSSGRSVALLGATVMGAASLALLGGNRVIVDELYDRNIDKLAMFGWLKPLISDFRWFGVGRGAFESVFPVYHTSSSNRIFTHAENFLLQWCAEWGVPVTVLALVAFLIALWPRFRRRERRMNMAMAVGVVLVLLQNLVDLALELPAVSIALAATLAAMWAGSRNQERRNNRRLGAIESRWIPMILPGISLLLGSLALGRGSHTVEDDRSQLHEHFAALEPSRHDDLAPLRREIHAMVLRHPAEPYFPLVGGTLAFIGRDQDPIPWIQRVLERSRRSGRGHLLLARALARRRATAQELLELRLAVDDEPLLAPVAANLALQSTRDVYSLDRAIPDRESGVAMLDALAARSANLEEVSLSRHFDERILAQVPDHPGAHLRSARAAIAATGEDATNCARASACAAKFERDVAVLAGASPRSSISSVLRAEMLAARGDAPSAERRLAQECQLFEDRAECLNRRAEIAAQLRPPEPLAEATRDLLAASCADGKTCAAAAAYAADLRARRGDWATAASLYARSVREDPTPERYLALGDAAGRAGLHGQAADAYERAASGASKVDTGLTQKIQEERALSHGSILPR